MVGSTRRAEVLESAARLQQLVPDAVLVGGTAAALCAGHRESFDHGHVLTDPVERYADVVEAVEASEGWVTSVRASSPPAAAVPAGPQGQAHDAPTRVV